MIRIFRAGWMIAGLAIIADGQSAPRYVFHQSSRLMSATVSVWRYPHFWSRGHFVRHLKIRDFSLWVNGRRWPIVALDRVRGNRRIAPPPRLPRGVYSNLQDSGRRNHVIYLLDYAHMTEWDFLRLRSQLRRSWRSALPANEMASIMTLQPGLNVDLSFTHSRRRLRSSLMHLDSIQAGGPGGVFMTTQAAASAGAGAAADSTMNQASPSAETFGLARIANFAAANPFTDAWTHLRELDARIQYVQTMSSLHELAVLLRGVPGHKSVLWFTRSTMVAAMAHPQNVISGGLYRKTVAALNAADVSLFPIDSAGLGVSGNGFSGAQAMARATGGHAFDNDNDLAGMARRAERRYAWSYVLYFAPPPSPASRPARPVYQRIRIRILRPGAHLAYRHGFYYPWRKTRIFRAQNASLRSLAYSPMDWSQIPLTARLGRLSRPLRVGHIQTEGLRKTVAFKAAALQQTAPPAATPKVRLLFYTVTLPAARMLHRQPGGWDYNFSVEALTVSTRTGAILSLPADHVRQLMTPAQARQLRSGELEFRGVFVLMPKMPAIGRILIRDNATGRLGSVSVPLPWLQ